MQGFELQQADGTGRLRARGPLTFETAAAALELGEGALRGLTACRMDLSGVSEGDSAGLAVLVEWLADAARRGGTLVYESVPAQILAVARISGLEGMFEADSVG
jgi:phospholipid transport system transporter-binding protein